MDPKNLVVGKLYKTAKPVKVCFYADEDCTLTDDIDLPGEYTLSYIGPDTDDGYVFQNSEGTKLCLHDNDLASIIESN